LRNLKLVFYIFVAFIYGINYMGITIYYSVQCSWYLKKTYCFTQNRNNYENAYYFVNNYASFEFRSSKIIVPNTISLI